MYTAQFPEVISMSGAYMRRLALFLAVLTGCCLPALSSNQASPDPCTSGHEFATTDCTLTWHGVTLYGAYDVGAGWVSRLTGKRL